MTIDETRTDDPGLAVVHAAARTLELAQTWLAWDGRPRLDRAGGRIYTPHKVIRRQADHFVDHLAQVVALLTGVPTQPNRWHESRVTTAADLAPFTEVDLAEASERLTRLARTFRLVILAAGPTEWDRPRGADWTIREIALHAADGWYAEPLGDLAA